MNQREAFTTLFNSGTSFQEYKQTVDRDGIRKKMDNHLIACDDSIEEYSVSLERANLPLKVLCIAESWCGDCANTVPILYKMAEKQDKWDFKIVTRDQNEDIFKNFYLTAGRKKVPVVIFADHDGDEIVRWVERPSRSYKLIRELKNKKLNKEDYMAEYRSIPELQAPNLTKEITRELVDTACRASNMIDILPSQKS